jgi:putative ABC transport system ATP-binding protein
MINGTMEDGSILQMINVHKRYGDGATTVEALRGITLSIRPLRFTMIVGASGSGKSTLLNLIGCIDKPSQGKIFLNGQDVTTLRDKDLTEFRAAHIGFIFQSFNLVPVLSAVENVEFALLKTDQSRADRRAAALQILDAVGLSKKVHQRPNQLSGGERQRVAIARALVKRPKIVLADEPTANLDSETGAAVVNLMHDMQTRFETTFIFSTHDPRLITKAEDLISLRDGLIVESIQK